MSDPNAAPENLADWIQQVLTIPLPALNGRYAEWGSAEKEIEPILHRRRSMPLEYRSQNPNWDAIGIVPDEMLLALHQYVFQQHCEPAIWDAIVFTLTHPLPESIAVDLLDRDIAVSALEHTRQVDSVQWRLADLGAEGLLTLAIEFYTLPQRSLEELDKLIRCHPTNNWMLRTLQGRKASSPEKEKLYWQILEQYPENVEFIRRREVRRNKQRAVNPDLSGQEWQYLYDQHEPEVWAVLAENEVTSEEKLWQLFATQEPVVWEGLAANSKAPKLLLKALYETDNPRAWRGLAANPQSSDEWLEAFLTIKNIEYANQIRIAAKENLRLRRKAQRQKERIAGDEQQ